MSNQTFDCPICFKKLSPHEPHVKTNCNHEFCFDCFTTHQYSGHNYSNFCPICRQQINPNYQSIQPIHADTNLLLSLLDLPTQSAESTESEWFSYRDLTSQPTQHLTSQPTIPTPQPTSQSTISTIQTSQPQETTELLLPTIPSVTTPVPMVTQPVPTTQPLPASLQSSTSEMLTNAPEYQQVVNYLQIYDILTYGTAYYTGEDYIGEDTGTQQNGSEESQESERSDDSEEYLSEDSESSFDTESYVLTS